jgi:hypothetical protein
VDAVDAVNAAAWACDSSARCFLKVLANASAQALSAAIEAVNSRCRSTWAVGMALGAIAAGATDAVDAVGARKG